jgi:hypothetical protein
VGQRVSDQSRTIEENPEGREHQSIFEEWVMKRIAIMKSGAF